ncbi:MAG: hypothetical protein DRJ40_00680 [Thermoprotei archaeon]|nr:MAG: hypothetical protein DRJ40_00680 [Thermoprotei archaeon]
MSSKCLVVTVCCIALLCSMSILLSKQLHSTPTLFMPRDPEDHDVEVSYDESCMAAVHRYYTEPRPYSWYNYVVFEAEIYYSNWPLYNPWCEFWIAWYDPSTYKLYWWCVWCIHYFYSSSGYYTKSYYAFIDGPPPTFAASIACSCTWCLVNKDWSTAKAQIGPPGMM